MRAPRQDENGLKKGPWSAEEDQLLIAYVTRYKIWNWSLMPKFAGLSRSGKSCRLRWVNYLDPGLKKGDITKEEEDIIISMYAEVGSRWSEIAARLPGRTDNRIKNYWHTHLKKHFEEKQQMPRIIESGTVNGRRSFTANVLNSDNSYNTASSGVTNSSETSDSESSNNLPITMTQSSLVAGESSSSSTGSAFGATDIDEIDAHESAGSSKVHIDKIPTEPFGFFPEDIHTEEKIAYAQEWYQEPLSPYGLYSNEYWLNILLGQDIDACSDAMAQ